MQAKVPEILRHIYVHVYTYMVYFYILCISCSSRAGHRWLFFLCVCLWFRFGSQCSCCGMGWSSKTTKAIYILILLVAVREKYWLSKHLKPSSINVRNFFGFLWFSLVFFFCFNLAACYLCTRSSVACNHVAHVPGILFPVFRVRLLHFSYGSTYMHVVMGTMQSSMSCRYDR